MRETRYLSHLFSAVGAELSQRIAKHYPLHDNLLQQI